MWKRLGEFVLKFRMILLVLLLAVTALMGYYASQVKLSYEFSKAIPTDNPKYKEYVAFKEKFGDDGNLLVAGIQTKSLFDIKNFNAYRELHRQLKKVGHVEDVLSISSAVLLRKDSLTEKLVAEKFFPDSINDQPSLDSAVRVFYS